MNYEPWQEIVKDNKTYYFQFIARYGGKDHIIVTTEPKGKEQYPKYLELNEN